jgi:hypothetical protein
MFSNYLIGLREGRAVSLIVVILFAVPPELTAGGCLGPSPVES